MRRPQAGGGAARTAIAGIAGGTAGTLAMSALMLAAERLGGMAVQPPRRVVDEAAEHGAPVGGSDRHRDRMAALLHLGIGAAWGVPEVALVRALDGSSTGGARAAVLGGAFGLGLWALNYVALAPALGILPPPSRDRVTSPPVMVAAHLVYGVTSALLATAARTAVAGPGRRRAARPAVTSGSRR